MGDSSAWTLWTGTAMERARSAADLSLAKLADRCRDLGVPIHRVALGKIEAGERTPTVDEMTVIAVALNTSPAMLLFGAKLVDGSVEVLPGLRTTASHALQWLSGDNPLIPDTATEYRRENTPIYLTRSLEEAQIAMRHYFPLIEEMIAIGGRPQMEQFARDGLLRRQYELDKIRTDIRNYGMNLSDDGDDSDA